MQKSFLSADEFLRDSWRLAAKITDSNWKPDTLIALWRGGAFAGMAVHEFFKVKGWNVAHLPMKCASYTGIGENAGEVVFSLGREIFSMIKKGEKVLVIDDVFDTGKTAKAIKTKLEEIGAEPKIATVYFKPNKNQTDITPDYYTKALDDKWIVFPHELEDLNAEELEAKDPVLKELLT